MLNVGSVGEAEQIFNALFSTNVAAICLISVKVTLRATDLSECSHQNRADPLRDVSGTPDTNVSRNSSRQPGLCAVHGWSPKSYRESSGIFNFRLAAFCP
jgi:hypothetical protein